MPLDESTSSDDHKSSSPSRWQSSDLMITPPPTPAQKTTHSIILPRKKAPKSTKTTTPLSPSPPSSPGSSSLSSLHESTGRHGKETSTPRGSLPPNLNRPTTPIKNNGPLTPDRPHFKEQDSYTVPLIGLIRGRTLKRRCVSADAAARAHSHFSSPNRFVSPRQSPLSTDSPYRLSKRPQTLSATERYTRSRDHSRDPFRSPSGSRSHQVVRQLSSSSRRARNPPHYIPHFVQDNEHDEVVAENNGEIDLQRQVSAGGVWNVGGASAAYTGPLPAVDNGRGQLLGSGSNAPMFVAQFLDQESLSQDSERHRNRLALALEIDEASRILPNPSYVQASSLLATSVHPFSPLTWSNGSWIRDGDIAGSVKRAQEPQKAVPATPFRVLDAPRLRDDFYCSTLAYSHTARTLAVGLSGRVYLWSEEEGVQYPPLMPPRATDYVTSLSFSSTDGGKSILAVGRQGGQISLWSTSESETRFQAQQPNPVSCLAFNPSLAYRQSESFSELVQCEDLLVGDDMGNIFYYSIEWPDDEKHVLYPHWTGTMTLLARVSAHSQQICGLAWSPDRLHFATGGNDNTALLFEIHKIIGRRRARPGALSAQPINLNDDIPIVHSTTFTPRRRSHLARLFDRQRHRLPFRPNRINSQVRSFSVSDTDQVLPLPPPPHAPSDPGLPQNPPMTRTLHIYRDRSLPNQRATSYTTMIPSHALNTAQRHTFQHAAAVKALAFPIWQPTLLATGGGSNDRAIHFFHTGSGATLATISVHAQVTSLIWSKTRREICATFGYAQPEHGIRIAVFAWPAGSCVVSIPWGTDNGNGNGPLGNGGGGGRALWAIAYPGGPNEGVGSARYRRRQRGSLSRGGRRGRRGGRVVGRGRGRDLPIDTNITTAGGVERPAAVGGSEDDADIAEEETAPEAMFPSASSPPSSSSAPISDGEGGTWWSRTEEEGCIIVASSDESVKFHEVWAGRASGRDRTATRFRRNASGAAPTSGSRRSGSGMGLGIGLGSMGGVLGGSDILEGLCEGIDLELGGGGGGGFASGIRGRIGEVIR